MFTLPRFFYDNAADQNAGGDTDTNNQQQQVNTDVNLLNPLFTESQLKDFGFDNVEQFKEHLQRHKENQIPEDVRKRNAEVEKADFLKVSAEEGIMNVDEYSDYERISKRPDQELVYEKFAAEFKADNPEATDELIRTEFNAEYKLDSENAKAKTRGESRLKKEAEDLRSPLTGKYNSAKSFVDTVRLTRKEQPAFEKFIDDLVQELTPDTFNIAKAKDDTENDADELDIPVKFTKEQRAEISKLFKSPKYFASYLENKDKLKETLAPGLTKKINSIIKVNNFDAAVNYALVQGKGIGRKRGSNVGAEQLYSVVRNRNTPEITKTDQQTLDENDRQMRQKYAR